MCLGRCNSFVTSCAEWTGRRWRIGAFSSLQRLQELQWLHGKAKGSTANVFKLRPFCRTQRSLPNPTNRTRRASARTLGRKPHELHYWVAAREDLVLLQRVCLAVIVLSQGRNCLEARINSFEEPRGWLSAAKHLQPAACVSVSEGRICLRGLLNSVVPWNILLSPKVSCLRTQDM